MWVYVLSIIVLILIILILHALVSYYSSQVITRKTQDEKELYKYQLQAGLIDKDYYESLEKEEVYLKSKDGLNLRGLYIKCGKNTNRTMIFVHGITVSLITSIKYTDMFLKRGWDVVIYDQRRHGNSEGKYSTYGYFEKEDLDLWVNWVTERKGNNEIIGLHGESMGAGTVIQYAAINKHVKFIIEDCGYSDLNELLKKKVQDDYHGLLMPILWLSNLRTRRKAKFYFSWVSPIEVVKNTDIPMMFIHGNKDYFVPWYMSIDMFNAKSKGIKKLYIAEGAGHARAIEVDKKKYEEEVMNFVDEVLKFNG